MTPNKKIRFSDRAGLVALKNDFVARRRTRTAQIMSLMGMMVIVMVGVAVIVYNDGMLASEICVLVGSVMFYIGRKYEKISSQLHAAEFMNAMFASALGRGYVFSLVAKPDGAIVYFDRGFQQMFPDLFEQPVRTLEALFDLYSLASADSQRILAVVSKAANETLSVSIAGGQNKIMQSLQLVIEPIPRPSGYVLLRGKIL